MTITVTYKIQHQDNHSNLIKSFNSIVNCPEIFGFFRSGRMNTPLFASVVLLLAYVHESAAFTIQPKIVDSSLKQIYHQGRYNPSSTYLSNKNEQQSEEIVNNVFDQDRNQSEGNILKGLVRAVRKRADTLRAAGFYENEQSKEFLKPVTAGAKTNITLFLLALGYKWYRSVFINKVRELSPRTLICDVQNN